MPGDVRCLKGDGPADRYDRYCNTCWWRLPTGDRARIRTDYRDRHGWQALHEAMQDELDELPAGVAGRSSRG